MVTKTGLELRQDVFGKIKRQVRLYLGEEPADLHQYGLAYKDLVERDNWSTSDRKELVTQILESDVVYGGDFHSYSQAQRTHLRLLREITAKRPVVLALECVPSQYQEYLEQWVSGTITTEQFLGLVTWQENWGFDWVHYFALMKVVKENGGRCVGLNLLGETRSARRLEERDEHASQIVSRLIDQKAQEDLVYVLYGDLHLAYIPGLVKKECPQAKSVSVYLNPEKVYFELAEKKGLLEGAVVKYSKEEFCLLESPPWVKWQSYLLYLEENIDHMLDEEDESYADYAEHIESLINIICADVDVEISKERTVYSFADEHFEELLEEKYEAPFVQHVAQRVKHDISFYDPEKKLAYLSRGTVNYAADLSGFIVHSEMSQQKQILLSTDKDFLALVWRYTVAFFLSKLINPHRKSMNLNDLKKQLQVFSDSANTEPLRLALDQKFFELQKVYGGAQGDHGLSQKPQDPMSYIKAAKILGDEHGGRWFRLYRLGHLPLSDLVSWMKMSCETPDFLDFYYKILKKIDHLELGGQNAD